MDCVSVIVYANSNGDILYHSGCDNWYDISLNTERVKNLRLKGSEICLSLTLYQIPRQIKNLFIDLDVDEEIFENDYKHYQKGVGETIAQKGVKWIIPKFIESCFIKYNKVRTPVLIDNPTETQMFYPKGKSFTQDFKLVTNAELIEYKFTNENYSGYHFKPKILFSPVLRLSDIFKTTLKLENIVEDFIAKWIYEHIRDGTEKDAVFKLSGGSVEAVKNTIKSTILNFEQDGDDVLITFK